MVQTGKPIMVVEDDPAVRQLIGEILRDAGHEVVECSSGEEALGCIDLVRPALITLDLAMPYMDGITFLRTLKKLPGLENTPVIFVTAAPESLRKAILSEEHVTISKPFFIDQLLHEVGRAIGLDQAVA